MLAIAFHRHLRSELGAPAGEAKGAIASVGARSASVPDRMPVSPKNAAAAAKLATVRNKRAGIKILSDLRENIVAAPHS